MSVSKSKINPIIGFLFRPDHFSFQDLSVDFENPHELVDGHDGAADALGRRLRQVDGDGGGGSGQSDGAGSRVGLQALSVPCLRMWSDSRGGWPGILKRFFQMRMRSVCHGFSIQSSIDHVARLKSLGTGEVKNSANN